MPSIFRRDYQLGWMAPADPDSDLDYGIACWYEGVTFVSVTWSIAGGGSPGPVLHDDTINGEAIVKDGVTYPAGTVASVWITQLPAGQVCTVTAHATFSDGSVDDRSFRLAVEER